MIRQRSPIVETYVQKIKVTESDGSWQPDGDHYFIGRAELSRARTSNPRNQETTQRCTALSRVFRISSISARSSFQTAFCR